MFWEKSKEIIDNVPNISQAHKWAVIAKWSDYSVLTIQGLLKVGFAGSLDPLRPSSWVTFPPIHVFLVLLDDRERHRSVWRISQRILMLVLLGTLCRHPVEKNKKICEKATVKKLEQFVENTNWVQERVRQSQLGIPLWHCIMTTRVEIQIINPG